MTPTLPSISDLRHSGIQTEISMTTVVSLDDTPVEHAELRLWLSALRSFLRVENLPFAEGDAEALTAHNWANEIAIINLALTNLAHITGRLSFKSKRFPNQFSFAELDELAQALTSAIGFCEQIANSGKIDFQGWTIFSRMLKDCLEKTAVFQKLVEKHQSFQEVNLPSRLKNLSRHEELRQVFGREVLMVLSGLNRLIEHLKVVGEKLRQDEPLKPSLLVFALVYDESKALLDLINNRILRFLPPENQFFDLLDGTSYILSMELRKVFHRELVGVTSMRSAPAIFARVETAHGLLQDCFQQSIIALAQMFQPELAGADVFSRFTTRLEQSLVLRRDLWTLLQMVQKLETATDRNQLARLYEKLVDFRQNSLRLLMFKDIETTERFIEEVLYMRRAAEIGHLLHRFGAYLETLLGQVNMRTVLNDHPFDYSSISE